MDRGKGWNGVAGIKQIFFIIYWTTFIKGWLGSYQEYQNMEKDPIGTYGTATFEKVEGKFEFSFSF